MKRNALVIGLILFINHSLVFGQSKLILIKAGRLVDVSSGQVLLNQSILIDKDQIIQVGNNIEIPSNTQIIDFSKFTVLPGLMDCHTHILADGMDYEKDLYRNSASFRSLRAAHYLYLSLQNGFTTLRDVCSEGAGYADVDLSRAVDSQFIPGPKLFPSGKGIAATGRYLPLARMQNWDIVLPSGTQYATGVDECRKVVREEISRGVKWIKLFADWNTTTFNQEEMNSIVNEAVKYHVNVAAHATSREGIRMAIIAGVKSIEHGDAMDDSLIEMAKELHVSWCPTLAVSDYYGENISEKYKYVRKAVDFGVNVVCGSDVGSFPWNINQVKELEMYVSECKLTPLEAIKTATVNAALLLGQPKLGEIKAGMQADLIAVPNEFVNDISNLEKVVFVMKAGKVFKNQILK